jgi:hypothetical protein
VLHLIFAGLPFYALALVVERRPAFWIAASILTLASWSYAVWQVWKDSLTGFAGGANIGLGLVMMGAPFVIMVVLVAVSLTVRASSDD